MAPARAIAAAGHGALVAPCHGLLCAVVDGTEAGPVQNPYSADWAPTGPTLVEDLDAGAYSPRIAAGR